MDQPPRPISAQERSKDALRLWLRMLSCSNAIERDVRSRLRREFSVTLPRFDLMAALERHPEGLSMSQLSESLMVSNGNVTGIVDRLVREGMLDRHARPNDRRSYLITMTASGRRNFDEMARAHEAWINDFFARLSDEDIASLTALLDRTRSALNDQATETPEQ